MPTEDRVTAVPWCFGWHWMDGERTMTSIASMICEQFTEDINLSRVVVSRNVTCCSEVFKARCPEVMMRHPPWRPNGANSVDRRRNGFDRDILF